MPGKAPPRFINISLTALPRVALLRHPGPKAPDLLLISNFLAIGPLTIIKGATGCVVGCMPIISTGFSHIAATAAINTGIYSGRQPAITALIAIFSTVASPQLGGTAAITSDGDRFVPVNILSTASSVGGMIGRPSVQPLEKYRLVTASAESATTISSEVNLLLIISLLHYCRITGQITAC